MALAKVKSFTTLELMLSALLLVMFIIVIPIFVLSARECFGLPGNQDPGALPPQAAPTRAQSPRVVEEGCSVYFAVSMCARVCVVCRCWGASH